MARPKKMAGIDDGIYEKLTGENEIKVPLDIECSPDERRDMIINVASSLFVKYINDRTKIDSVINNAIDDAVKFVDAIDKVE
jgi:hypothetical protein